MLLTMLTNTEPYIVLDRYLALAQCRMTSEIVVVDTPKHRIGITGARLANPADNSCSNVDMILPRGG